MQEDLEVLTEAAHPAPSTYDVFGAGARAIMAGGQDAELATLVEARKRYEVDATAYAYVGRHGEVCAAGAIMVVDDEGIVAYTQELLGLNEGDFVDVQHAALRHSARVSPAVDLVRIKLLFEEKATAAAKGAMRRVNKAAVALYSNEFPEMANWHEGGLYAANGVLQPFGPIELVNQCSARGVIEEYLDPATGTPVALPEFKARVLRCYDHAIEQLSLATTQGR